MKKIVLLILALTMVFSGAYAQNAKKHRSKRPQKQRILLPVFATGVETSFEEVLTSRIERRIEALDFSSLSPSIEQQMNRVKSVGKIYDDVKKLRQMLATDTPVAPIVVLQQISGLYDTLIDEVALNKESVQLGEEIQATDEAVLNASLTIIKKPIRTGWGETIIIPQYIEKHLVDEDVQRQISDEQRGKLAAFQKVLQKCTKQ